MSLKRPTFYCPKRPVIDEIVAVLNAKGSGLELSEHMSRSLKLHEIHEIMATRDDASPGSRLTGFTARAFFEVKQGGHTIIGDRLTIDEKPLGTLAGYEMNRMPNHMNIIFHLSGEITKLDLGATIKITSP